MKKLSGFFIVIAVVFFFSVPAVLAHVTVKPAEVGIGARTNFVVSVPTEESVPTTQVRLVIPEGVKSVRPNVMAGWNISLTKSGEGEDAAVREITWSGGSIPADMRSEFIFSAQAPSSETELAWKAYQTYANGLIVAWETDPKTIKDTHAENAPKPFSVTKVVNDFAASSIPVANNGESNVGKGEDSSSAALFLSIAAVLIAGFSLYLQLRSKKK